MTAPVNVSPPYVGGAPPVVGATLVCTMGTWLNAPDGYAYQWRKDSADLSGADANQLPLTAADEGSSFDCAVTASNADGQATSLSNAVGPVAVTVSAAEQGLTSPEEQRARGAQIEAMGVEAWKDANDDRKQQQSPTSWRGSTRSTPHARAAQNPAASR